PGRIEVAYLQPRPAADEGPFLKEERALIDSLAKLIESFLERRRAQDSIRQAYKRVEQKFQDRTVRLRHTNRKLRGEIQERRRAERRIRNYQNQLKRLTSELALTEEKERRSIAADLHDQIGQSLAIIKMKFLELHCNTMLCKFRDNIEELRLLLDEAIEDTRSLTFEISPPVLYELGLEAAIQWLAEECEKKYKLKAQVTTEGTPRPVSDDLKITVFKGVRELLINAVKHSRAHQVWVRIVWSDGQLKTEVRDNGVGFDKTNMSLNHLTKGSFGLFSVRERIGYLGGKLDIKTMPGQGVRSVIAVPTK
ncbi:MAG: sensor histidine kinase, partial [Candidatus Edwardsbacteria bacterium]|nr:sensor histidine kinase [Candidatus Edwardsbacteria bacterium]